MEMLQNIFVTVGPYVPVIVAVAAVLIILTSMIKIASGNEVLVITGIGATKKISRTVTKRIPYRDKENVDGKEALVTKYQEIQEEQITYVPKIRIAGASLVIPFLQKSRRVDICVMKAVKDNDTMKTVTGVEIVIDWGISYAPNADSIESIQPFVRQFLDKELDEREEIVMSAVAGGMRAVISKMTPTDVMTGKETLDELVQENISVQMEELGYKVQLYIQEVRDAEGSKYYYDLAADDRETNRKKAAQITAEAEQEVRQKTAESNRIATEAELEAKVAIAQKEKETAVKRAEFKTETDIAEANAAVAGKLQTAEREQEVVEKNGLVEVKKQQQADLAAQAEQKVAITKAETEKKEAIIRTQAESEQKQITAQAEAEVALRKATGEADAAKATAGGKAEAVKMEAQAEAEKITILGKADAEAISAKGKAEAEAIEAKGRAEAEAARALSDAQAANDRVNFEIKKLEIENNAKIEIATRVATVMANIGEKATFYDFSGKSAEGGDLLSNVLGNIPQLFKKANLTNQALNEEQVTDTIHRLVESFADPLKSLAEKKTVVKAEQPESNNSKEEPPAVGAVSDAEVLQLNEGLIPPEEC